MIRTASLLSLFALFAGCTEETAPTDTPASSSCTDGVCILTGTIVEDMTLTADTQWLLRGMVFFGDDENEAVLTIEPGTVIYGESSTDGALVIRRNSRILAEGTVDAPIVFTSSKSEGTRARGDWGGLIVNGNAPINNGDDSGVGFGEGGTGFYGGNDPADDSGVLSYVRVEFAGTLISPDNELNGIAFQGVGNGTTVDHVQVHMNADDGVEFFGGTVNAKHVLVTGVGDDSLDWTDGWTGNLQFAVLQQYDDAAGDNGIEADNNDSVDLLPRSMPTLSNVTVIGSPDSEKSDFGMHLKVGTAGHISNTIVAGFNDACLNVDDEATFDQLGTDLTFTNVLLDCAANFEKDDQDFDGDDANDADPVDLETTFLDGTGNAVDDDGGLVNPYDLATPDFASTATGAIIPADAFFETVDFIGGVGPDDDWTAGWTTAARN